MKGFFDDKQIVNPMEPDDVFTCSDLVEDYRICRKEKRMQTSKLGKRMNCTEYRALGKSCLSYIDTPIHERFWLWTNMLILVFVFAANKCYYMDEDEFIDHIIEKFHEKRRYADFLEKEGSILAESSRANQSIFRLRTGAGPEADGGVPPPTSQN